MKTTLHIILIAALSLFSKLTYSQLFTDLNSQLPGLESGSAAWADYDNDGDSDFFYTQRDGIVELWINDGELQFTLAPPDIGLPVVIADYADNPGGGAAGGYGSIDQRTEQWYADV